MSFNPAEAREWFSRKIGKIEYKQIEESFNPAEAREWFSSDMQCLIDEPTNSFNPAEAREWFSS